MNTITAIFDAFKNEMSQKTDIPDNPEYTLPVCKHCGAHPPISYGKHSESFMALHRPHCRTITTHGAAIWGKTREECIAAWNESAQ